MPITASIYIVIVFSILISVTTLVNLAVDLKQSSKAYPVLLLCQNLHNSIGALSALPWYILYDGYYPAVCAGLTFVMRLCSLGSMTIITLLAFERLLSLVASFWYDLHVTVKPAVMTSVVASVATALLSTSTFFVENIEEIQDIFSNTTVTVCPFIPPTLVSLVMASVSLGNVALTLAFNISFMRQLQFLHRVMNANGRNDTRTDSPEEAALFRLVIALSVVSVLTNLPMAVIAIWRILAPKTLYSARVLLSVMSGIGLMANSVVFMGCTARYRRRLRRCLASAVRALRNRCRRDAVEPLDVNTTNAARDLRNHDETVLRSNSVVRHEMVALPTAARQDAFDAGPEGKVQTDC